MLIAKLLDVRLEFFFLKKFNNRRNCLLKRNSTICVEKLEDEGLFWYGKFSVFGFCQLWSLCI